MTKQWKTETSTGGAAGHPESPDGPTAKAREIVKRLPAIGYVTWLYSQSKGHRQLFIQDMEWRVFPPVVLGQYKLRIDDKVGGLPTAYASWAFLSQEAESSYRATHKLRPGDWHSGDRLWLVDCVAPFGGAAALLEELYSEVHGDRETRLLYSDTGGIPVETTLSELLQRSSGRDTGTSRAGASPRRH
ncbi:MAG: toxin-activating lysine-acyltransferase [Gammaproteobacteria bacterium]|nr:toxin-activating lysine-acyltransferase [Gammaproteobacteria bacterium]